MPDATGRGLAMKFRSARIAPVTFTFLALAMAGCASTATSAPPSHAACSRPAGAPRSSSASAGAAGCAAGPGTTSVSTAAQLAQALAAAQPGGRIVLAPGIYHDDFVATTSGTAAAPITLCGSRSAVLEGLSMGHGYVLHLNKASWWRVEGFTVEGGQKGVVTDGVTHDLIYGLYVHTIGDEAIHLRDFSSNNTVSHNIVRDTGQHKEFYGE